MLDVFHLPKSEVADIQIFTTPSTVTNIQWNSWLKPRGKSMCFMICIGGGGGGGGGFTAGSGNARAGGGSGGSSAVTRIETPIFLLPDQLYIQVGAGGVGGAAGATGSNGVLSYIAIAPNTTASNIIAISGAAAAVGGGGGNGSTGGAGGTAGTIAVIASMPLAGLGHFFMIAGQIGVIGGGTAANGTAQVIPVTSVITTGGSSGAGCTSSDFAGGAWTAITNSWLSEQRPATPAAGSFNGSGGFPLWKPMFFFGGTGGSSSNTSIGGHGGNGSYGSGGGGGGGGTTGGSGGSGGQGIVIIISW